MLYIYIFDYCIFILSSVGHFSFYQRCMAFMCTKFRGTNIIKSNPRLFANILLKYREWSLVIQARCYQANRVHWSPATRMVRLRNDRKVNKTPI